MTVTTKPQLSRKGWFNWNLLRTPSSLRCSKKGLGPTLLNPVGVVYSEIIKEFFSNAAMDGDCIEC